MSDDVRGPVSWEEWRAFDLNAPGDDMFEAELYSDAHITNHVMDGIGPFQLLNALGSPSLGLKRALVLRATSHRGGLDHLDPSRSENTDSSTFHGGDLPEEVAALVSLALGIRCRSAGISRLWGLGNSLDPLGQPIDFNYSKPEIPPASPRGQVLPHLRRTVDVADAVAALQRFRQLTAKAAVQVMRAARLYQQAVWVADGDPNQSWLQLVSALEVAAARIADKRSSLERLDEDWPELARLFRTQGDGFASEAARLVGPVTKAQRRLLTFVDTYKPPPPADRPEEWAQIDWGELLAYTKTIYDYRSRALHDGTPFPLPMCEPPDDHGGKPAERPLGLASSALGSVWIAADTPMMLSTFEYIVRACLQNWWADLRTE